jgi:hypothetical protein
MALVNPNIALSVQPIQQPNMLAMAGQAENIRSARQTGELADTKRQILQEQNTQQQALARSRETLRFVQTPDQYLAWIDGSFKDPVIGSMLKQMGVDPAQSRSQVLAELQQPGGFERAIQKSAANVDQLSGIMGKRAEDLIAERQAQAARAAAAQRQAMVQGNIQTIAGGGTGPVNALTPVSGAAPAPVNALTTGATPPAAAVTPQAAAVTPQATAVTPQATAPGMETPADTALPQVTAQPPSQFEVLKDEIGQLRRLAALDPVNRKTYSDAADQLEKQLKLVEPTASKLPTSVQEYEYAVKQGYQGTFDQYQDARKNPLFENEYVKKVGVAKAEEDIKLVNSAEAAVQALPKIYETLNLIEDSDTITGVGAELLKGLDRLRSQFLRDVRAGKRVSNTETLDAYLGSEVFPLINALGIGARGLDTPAEREFLRQVMTGTITLNRDTLVRLTELRRDGALGSIKKYNSSVDSGKLNRFYETRGESPRKIEAPTRTPAMSPQDRQALNWANSNPNDPRSAEIKRRLGR